MQPKSILLGFVCLIAGVISSKGQQTFFSDPKRYILPKYEAGLSANYLIYQGDLSTRKSGNYFAGTPGLGLHGVVYLHQYVAVSASAFWGKIQEDESRYGGWHSKRNFKFNSEIFSTEVNVRFNLQVIKPPRMIFNSRLVFLPYVFVGAGLAKFNPKSSWVGLDRNWFNEERLRSGLAQDSTQAYDKQSWFVSAGVGVCIYENQNFNIFIQNTWRYLNSDYLDGFSKSVDGINDSYTNLTIGISWILYWDAIDPTGCPRDLELLISDRERTGR